jgi:small subunit ribosomal protein S1
VTDGIPPVTEKVRKGEGFKMSEEIKGTAETMADFATELEASYKEYDERRHGAYQEPEGPDAEKWANLAQMMEDKTVSKVKVKEAVKAGLIAYIDEIQGFIPASQISTKYVEKLEDWVGQTLEVVPITVDVEKKRLVLSGKAVQQEKEAAEKAAKLAAAKVGAVVEGVVDGIKDYGAFVRLDNGLSGLLHVSQISKERVKNPGAVLKEGQKITAKIIKNENGKISLSMKALEPNEEKVEEEVFNYKEKGSAVTGLGDLLKGLKL